MRKIRTLRRYNFWIQPHVTEVDNHCCVQKGQLWLRYERDLLKSAYISIGLVPHSYLMLVQPKAQLKVCLSRPSLKTKF